MRVLFSGTFALALISSASCFAMGGKPAQPDPSPTCGGVNLDRTPKPVRRVVLRPMSTKLFPLPNGTQVDLSASLQEFLNTAVSKTATLAPADPSSAGTAADCDTTIEIRSAITTLEMEVMQLGLTVGYTPTGPYTSPITNAQGKMDLKVGLIGMDFSIWKCVGGQCTAVTASHADQNTTQLGLKIQVDFSTMTSAAQLVYNTSFGQVLQDILKNGVDQIANSSRIHELPWHAMVREYQPETGSVTFDAGLQSRIQPDQTFTVFAATEGGSACNVYRSIAQVHTTQVTPVSSTAVIDQALDSRKPQSGDVVMILEAAPAR